MPLAPDATARPGRSADLEFIVRVHAAAMRPHVEAQFGRWDAAEQRRRMLESDPTAHAILELGGRPVGCELVRRAATEIQLVRLYLLPEAQSLGIGSQRLRKLGAEADALGIPVRLQVLKANPARRLYERHGYVTVDETDTHYRMRRVPGVA